MSDTPVFTTERLVLRPLRREDADALHALYGDEKATYWSSRPPHTSVGETRERVAKSIADPDWRNWAITRKDDDTAIGTLGAYEKRQGKVIEIGSALVPAQSAPASPAANGRELADAVAGIARQQAPMLEVLRASLARQDILNQALIELFDRLGNAPAAGGAHAPRPDDGVDRKADNERALRARGARDAAFERELARLRFREDLEAGNAVVPPTPDPAA